jgi:hypothetical protein
MISLCHDWHVWHVFGGAPANASTCAAHASAFIPLF